MKCPYCGYAECKVTDSRPIDDNAGIRRRRECQGCGGRFTTFETVETLPVVVVKKDGSRESFDRDKVLLGMMRACEKRKIPVALDGRNSHGKKCHKQKRNVPEKQIIAIRAA